MAWEKISSAPYSCSIYKGHIIKLKRADSNEKTDQESEKYKLSYILGFTIYKKLV